MRALDVLVFVAIFCACIAGVSLVYPQYGPLPVGNSSFSAIAAWQMSGLTPTWQAFGGDSPNIIDYARLTVELIYLTIYFIISLFSVFVLLWPILVNVLMIPSPVATVLQLIWYVILGIGFAQVLRGGFTWKAYE